MGNRYSGKQRPLMERLLGYIDVADDGCWLWTASITTAGYGRMNLDGTHQMAHRVMWVVWNGQAVPDGYELDHLCRVRRCVNPAHLEPVTHSVNVRRGLAGQLRCCDHPREERCVVNGLVAYCRACRRVKRQTKTCVECGREYEGTPNRRYCSADCRNEHDRIRFPRRRP